MNEEEKKMLQAINERTIRLDEKMDSVNEMKSEVKHIRTTSDASFNKAVQNEADIRKINENLKWVWRGIAGAVVAMILWFLQHEIPLK